MTEYVAGFLFNPELDVVLLIEKTRPQWQNGYFNGVGGHVEKGEPYAVAMRREFREETSIEIDVWLPFCVLEEENCRVHFYCAQSEKIYEYKNVSDEGELEICPVFPHGPRRISNLRWLIPMALSAIKGEFVVSACRYSVQEVPIEL